MARAGISIPSTRMILFMMGFAVLAYRLALEWKTLGDFMFNRKTTPTSP